MNNYLTIGEVAKITRLPISTLRYYDSQGIVEPYYKDEKTNYRYYRLYQIPILQMVVHLKKLGFNNASIKSHLKNLNYAHTLKLMDKMMAETRKEIERLEVLEEELKENAAQMRYLIRLENEVDTFFEEEMAIDGIYADITDNNSYEGISRAFKKLDSLLYGVNQSFVPMGLYAFTISEKRMIAEEYQFDKLVVLKKFENYNERYIIPKKHYICLVCQGSFDTIDKNIQRVKDKTEEKNVEIDGDTIINIVSGPAFQKNPFEAMYILKVPIKKKNME
ncbi:MerR family transcriptional regulator [Fusobacterium sp.]|uniref:MerR family transcriptional regulator n=1 Tax=Fusobacterium sp. TaxID=68766 RepID=UPI00396CBD68